MRQLEFRLLLFVIIAAITIGVVILILSEHWL